MKILRFALSVVLGIALPLAVQLWDRRRLTVAQRAAAWNVATWGAALYAFGPLSMLGWCWVTRGAWRGRPGVAGRRGRVAAKAIGLGLLSAAGIWAVIVSVDHIAALALGVPP